MSFEHMLKLRSWIYDDIIKTIASYEVRIEYDK